MPKRDPCRGKIRHRNEAGARIAMCKMNDAGLNVYKCGKCHGWHVGHSSDDWHIQARLDQLLGLDPHERS